MVHQSVTQISDFNLTIFQPGGCAANKTGTLNTKSVTASQLAQDSPVLPHKMAPGYPGSGPPAAPAQVKIPPAVPPRTRDSVSRAQLQTITSLTNGLATIKRSSLGRAEGQQMLEEVFRASTLSRRGGGGADSGRVPFRREASVPRSGLATAHGGQGSAANWSDSLPRKDLFFASQTNSLPRRDKAGLGRPEPAKKPPAGPGPGEQGDREAGDKREAARDRSNPFRDHILGGEEPTVCFQFVCELSQLWLTRQSYVAADLHCVCVLSGPRSDRDLGLMESLPTLLDKMRAHVIKQ